MKLTGIVFLTINLFFNPFPAYSQQGNAKTSESASDTLTLLTGNLTDSKVYEEIDLMSLLKEIDEPKNNKTTPPLIRLKRLDSLYQLQRVHSEYLSLKTKYELFLITTEKEKRIFLLKSIRVFPFYTIREPYYGREIGDLYRKATRDLIREYRGNLEELNRIDIVPSMYFILVGFLEAEIKLAGGAGDYAVPDYVVNMINPTFSNGCGDGKIDLVFTGGRPPFDVAWTGPNGFSHSISDVSGNNEGEDISNLIPGIYTLKTTDSRCGVREEKFEIICTYKY